MNIRDKWLIGKASSIVSAVTLLSLSLPAKHFALYSPRKYFVILRFKTIFPFFPFFLSFFLSLFIYLFLGGSLLITEKI